MQFPIFPRLRDDLGETAARALVETFGGRELAVPRRVNPRDSLTLLIGVPSTTVLIQRYGGKVIRLPQMDWRPSAIRQLRSDGKAVSRIAAMVSLSERQVYRILARTPAPAVAAAGR